MNVKTYRAETMGEAFAKVKRDLGRQAVILKTRRVRTGRLLWPFGRKVWEVTASPNADLPDRASQGLYLPTDSTSPSPFSEEAEPTASSSSQDHSDPVDTVDTSDTVEAIDALIAASASAPADEELVREVTQLRQVVAGMTAARAAATAANQEPANEPAGAFARLRQRLLDQDVEASLADELIRQGQAEFAPSESVTDEAATRRLHGLIARCIVVGPPAPKRDPGAPPRVVALIGPTGVGKTTTIAKLAAAGALRQSLKVAMVTMDTYRIAAVEQLRTYAELINVPLHAVLTPEELRDVVESLRDHDLILIDTAGRSQNDHVRLSHLARFVKAAKADEVHLVVSATANSRTARQVIANFAPLGANRVILTKLDEADSLGIVLNLSVAAGVPISYVTTGQEVPEDIEFADAGRLANRLLGGAYAAR